MFRPVSMAANQNENNVSGCDFLFCCYATVIGRRRVRIGGQLLRV